MKKLKNWLGQLRLYSLVDLWLLLAVATNNNVRIVGGLLLHIAFLLMLENMHRDRGRVAFPSVYFPLTLLVGMIAYENMLYAVAYIFLSWIYSRKKIKPFGLFSPITRGIQTWILIGGISGSQVPLAISVGLLMMLRNLMGDVRDVNKDRTEKVQTLPVIIHLSGNYPRVHQYTVHATTLIWWLMNNPAAS